MMCPLLFILFNDVVTGGIVSPHSCCCCRCGRFPPEVRTAIPVDGRFEHIVLSCNATSDHGIVWIEKEASKAMNVSLSLSTVPSIVIYFHAETSAYHLSDKLICSILLR